MRLYFDVLVLCNILQPYGNQEAYSLADILVSDLAGSESWLMCENV